MRHAVAHRGIKKRRMADARRHRNDDLGQGCGDGSVGFGHGVEVGLQMGFKKGTAAGAAQAANGITLGKLLSTKVPKRDCTSVPLCTTAAMSDSANRPSADDISAMRLMEVTMA